MIPFTDDKHVEYAIDVTMSYTETAAGDDYLTNRAWDALYDAIRTDATLLPPATDATATVKFGTEELTVAETNLSFKEAYEALGGMTGSFSTVLNDANAEIVKGENAAVTLDKTAQTFTYTSIVMAEDGKTYETYTYTVKVAAAGTDATLAEGGKYDLNCMTGEVLNDTNLTTYDLETTYPNTTAVYDEATQTITVTAEDLTTKGTYDVVYGSDIVVNDADPVFVQNGKSYVLPAVAEYYTSDAVVGELKGGTSYDVDSEKAGTINFVGYYEFDFAATTVLNSASISTVAYNDVVKFGDKVELTVNRTDGGTFQEAHSITLSNDQIVYGEGTGTASMTVSFEVTADVIDDLPGLSINVESLNWASNGSWVAPEA